MEKNGTWWVVFEGTKIRIAPPAFPPILIHAAEVSAGTASKGLPGQAVFDSVPKEIIGKRIVCSISNGEKYRLKDPKQEYVAADQVNIEIEPIPPIPTNKPVILSTPGHDCPQKTPGGQPLGSDKPNGKKSGFTAVAGYYKKINENCEWITGGWKKIGSEDCPAVPPSSASTQPSSRPGHTWEDGYYIKENGQCKWMPGFWKENAPATPLGPTYVPPIQPPTYDPSKSRTKPARGG